MTTTFFHWFVAIYLVLSEVHTFYSLPAIDNNAIDYLRNFGYLPPKKSHNGIPADDILHEDVLTNAIKRLQSFGHIEQSGVIDAATKELLKKPRCGNPDFEWPDDNDGERKGRRRKRYALGHSKWDKKDITWSFTNKNHPKSHDEENQILRLITEAMEVWQHSSILKIRRTRDNLADIRIDFAKGEHGDNYPFNGPGNNLAHAFYPGTEIGGDVHMDEDEPWDIENGKGGDLSFFFTLLHELGHSFGLNHSNNTESIMYPYYISDRRFDRKCKVLYDDDVNGIEQLYGKKDSFKYGRTCIDGSSPFKPTKVPGFRDHSHQHHHHYSERPQTTPRIPPVQTYRPDPRIPDSRTQRTNERRRPTTLRPRIEEEPDRCNISVDAIAFLRTELMIFKGKWFWRLRRSNDGSLEFLSNGRIGQMWKDLASYDHIDAVFEMKDGKFAFFIGRKVYLYDTQTLVGTTDMSHFGFDHQLKRVDAIFKWSHNNSTYIFSGNYYWRVNEHLHVDKNEIREYPRPIGQVFWKGVDKIDVDTAFTYEDTTYFLSGLLAYKFDNGRAKLDLDKPIVSSKKWLQCKFTDDELQGIQTSARVQTSDAPSTSTMTTFSSFTSTTSPVQMTTKKSKKRFTGIIYIDPNNININAIAQDLLKSKNSSLIGIN